MNRLRKSDLLDDWYVLDGAPFRTPEGSEDEWRELLHAIEFGVSEQVSKRLAVLTMVDDSIKIYSPCNAINDCDYVRIDGDEIDEWIEHAESVLDGDDQ